MKILFVHSLMFHHRTWMRATEQLAGDGIEICLTSQMSAVAFLEIEGDMEENMGDVMEAFQGSKVEVLTADDVKKCNFKWRIA